MDKNKHFKDTDKRSNILSSLAGTTSIKDEGSKYLVGIGLTRETDIQDSDLDSSLGVISCTATETLHNVKNDISMQLKNIPHTFSFVTKEGWPITEDQESDINVEQLLTKTGVLRIIRTYDKPRVGISLYGGSHLGFVFIELSSSISILRGSIQEQLGSLSHLCQSYQVLDSNKWPLSLNQESSLTVLDVLDKACVYITSAITSLSTSMAPPLPAICDNVDYSPFLTTTFKKRSAGTHTGISKHKRTPHRQLSFSSSKDEERLNSLTSCSDILISYVRAEAADHAIKLKKELTQLGFSVFLDVHEIRTGIDWQDALNYAVSNCETFVPLVTPRYGETQWTNREVKLADVLAKFILPINFLDSWPPRCLAIQFATTQFIPWASDHFTRMDSNSDYAEAVQTSKEWPQCDVSYVAKMIGERISEFEKVKPTDDDTQLSKRMSLRSCPVSLPEGFTPLSQDREGKTLIVVSVHPTQKQFGSSIKEMLESEGMEIWCSTELENDEELDSDYLGDSQDSNSYLTKYDSDLCASGNLCSGMLSSSQLSYSSRPAVRNKRKRFQKRADEAALVMFVISEKFAQSRLSKQQVFYCEHRKKCVFLKYEDFTLPGWMSMLIGSHNFVTTSCEMSIKSKIQARLNSISGTADEKESKITSAASKLKNTMQIGDGELCVYVSGGTKFRNNNSQAICTAIGEHLATLESVHVVTGGFYGVGETVSRSFHNKRAEKTVATSTWHILPFKDEKDRTHQCRQNADRTFPEVDYGTTLYSGDCVRERETIVSRAFDVCILVEGGPGAAHEAEEFAWNDHVVVPVKSTGGAASGQFGVPEKIFKVPCGIEPSDWSVLEDNKSLPEEIGQSVARIVVQIIEQLRMDITPAKADEVYTSIRTSPRRKKSKGKKDKVVIVEPGDACIDIGPQ